MGLIRFYRSGAKGVSLPDAKQPGAIFIVNRDDENGDMYVDFDTATRLHIAPDSPIIFMTVDELDNARNKISERGKVYYIINNENIAKCIIKVGDGTSPIIDLPQFTTVSIDEKEFWNNKVSVSLDGENLIFTTE